MPVTLPTDWRNIQRCARFWGTHLHASPFVTRAITLGFHETPVHKPGPNTAFRINEITVSPEDIPWLTSELSKSLRRRLYELVPSHEARRLHVSGYPISNAFIVHHDDKRRLVVNLSQLDGF